jgi:hypothetical protein
LIDIRKDFLNSPIYDNDLVYSTVEKAGDGAVHVTRGLSNLKQTASLL